ncbi:MAG: hypothetical protein WD794_13370 [Mycobacteriales bacterium]
MSVALRERRAGVAPPEAFRPVPSLRVAAALAVPEAWRIVRHPVALVGLTLHLVLFTSVADNGPRDAFDVMSTASTFFYGVFVFFAANLVATRTRRDGSREMLAPLAAGEHERTLALCLASLGPTLLNVVLNATGYLMLELRGLFEVHPTFWHLAQGPLTVFGAALLGVMVARWAPYPGMALVVMVAMFAWNIWQSNDGIGAGLLGTYVSWAVYGPGTAWYGVHPGSPAWHAAYLAALCGMAAAGAVLRTSSRPWRVLPVGAACTAAAVLTGWAQLP